MPQIANGDGGAATRALLNSILPNAVAFATSVPLDGRKVMAAQTIAATLAFAPAASPALGGECLVRLTADGAHPPSFPGFVEHGSSAGWYNTAGIVNLVRFWHDGVGSWYAVSQALNTIPLVMQSAVVAAASPTRISVSFPVELAAGAVPAPTAFALTNSGGRDTVTAVSVAGSTVTLTKSRTTAVGDAMQLAYTPPATNPLADGNGNLVSASTIAVTNNVVPAANYLRFGSLSNMSESANAAGGWDYAETSAAGYGTAAGKGVADKALPAGQDGWIEFVLAGNPSAGPIFGFLPSAGYGTYTDFSYSAYVTNGQVIVLYAGAGSQPASTQPPSIAAGHRLRIERAGGAVTCRYSIDDGASYLTLHSFPATGSTATLYVGAMIGQADAAGRVLQPRASANVA